MACKIIVSSQELKPKNGRKSFYNKAKIITDDECNRTLKSYDSYILTITRDNRYIPLVEPDKISVTTATHLISFCGMKKSDYIYLWNNYEK